MALGLTLAVALIASLIGRSVLRFKEDAFTQTEGALKAKWKADENSWTAENTKYKDSILRLQERGKKINHSAQESLHFFNSSSPLRVITRNVTKFVG
jgi:hypothetical protein